MVGRLRSWPQRGFDSSIAFLPVFKTNHASETPEQSFQLRLRMLQFTTLFTRRYTPNKAIPAFEELQALRHVQSRRAIAWYGNIPLVHVCRALGLELDGPGVSMLCIRQARELVYQQLSIPPDASAFYTSPSAPSLLDLLPMFLAVAAAFSQMEKGNITEQLMELAASFMQQAVLEQYLLLGSRGSELTAEAFAWGYRNEPPTGWDDEVLVNDMFGDEDLHQEVEGWADVHERYLNEFKATENSESHEQLTNIAQRSPISEFEDRILSFLEILLDALPTPDLTQLETGQLDGLSRQQTEDLKKRVRYNDMR